MTNRSLSRFPAILIGGPPHTGKSVLSYSLKEALKKAGVQCYLLRAAPDGEGDWSQEAAPDLAQDLRRKGRYTTDWVEHICYDIAYRPLPFLVDVGGRPQPWQEAIFDQCTHAILLSTDAGSQAYWQEVATRYNLLVIADLTSRQEGQSSVEVERPVLKGTITRLERGHRAEGPVFETLLGRVKALFSYDYAELLNIHQAQAPIDLVVDIPKMYRQLKPGQSGVKWQPQDLPAVLEYLPPETPLALYGIGPTWLYAAIAAYAFPAKFYQFDARRGWVEPVSISTDTGTDASIKITVETSGDCLSLTFDILKDYLEYQPHLDLALPEVPPTGGVILSGKLPIWLYTGLVHFYRQADWVALYYPHLNQAVVVSTRDGTSPYFVGDLTKQKPTGA